MWPVKSVGITSSPAPSAQSITATNRPIMARSIRDASGWKSSQVRKMRTESKPLAAIRRKSVATSVASKRDHHRMAVRAGQ
jgi:hypothetical protein